MVLSPTAALVVQPRVRGVGAAVAGWSALVVVAVVVGRPTAEADLGLGAAPLAGRWEVHLPPLALVAIAVAVAVVALGPAAASRLPWRAVLGSSAAAATTWAVALASLDGWDRVTAPLTTRHEYEPFAATIGSAPDFVRGFTAAVPDLPTHVKAHPPLATLVPWGLDRIGLGGAGWYAALVLAAWGVAVAATLVAARCVLGEARARAAAPALVLLPAVVWAATSADALTAGVVATGVALAVGAPRPSRLLAGGCAFGVAVLLSYGATLGLAVPLAVAWHRRRLGDLVPVGAGIAGVLLLAAAAGFWWPAGLQATGEAYWGGIAGRRPLAYLALLGNPAALAFAVGPAVAVGLARRWNPLVAGGVLAVVVADLSLLSAGEVERIWLPFVPFIALAAPGLDRRWLGAQAAVGLGLQIALRSPW
jgi:hypothetical protein